VTFPSSVRLAVDAKDAQPSDLAWRRCVPGGCVADNEVKEDIVRRWRQQTASGQLRFKEGDGRDVVMPFSFRGLAQALDALPKS
jgi:invasion protein IalB